jgi:restriction system protein
MTDLIYRDEKKPKAQSQSKDDIIIVDDQMIQYFTKHPEDLYNLNPRRFEELVAAILKDLGYSVELTAQSADGGVDIFATQKSGVGEVLIVVDCKRYARNNHVGVGIARSLFGIGEQTRATMAMVATTSFFTRAAKEFQRSVRHRLSLKDYNDLLSWLSNYGILNNRRKE